MTPTSRNALILDCDGVLADTERDGHLVAFNRTFDELGLPFQWSLEEYAELLKIGGGKERMLGYLRQHPELDFGTPEEMAEKVAAAHKRKSEVYIELVEQGALPGRPGVKRLIEEALDAGWTVAVASTSATRASRPCSPRSSARPPALGWPAYGQATSCRPRSRPGHLPAHPARTGHDRRQRRGRRGFRIGRPGSGRGRPAACRDGQFVHRAGPVRGRRDRGVRPWRARRTGDLPARARTFGTTASSMSPRFEQSLASTPAPATASV